VTTILLVKTSSLGDVVHNLPVVADIRRALPEATVDWVVEESFAAIPALSRHGLRRVIPCALRRWRRGLLGAAAWREIGTLRDALHAGAYDVVVDTQGLLKSALLARLAPGVRHGLDWRSSREPLAWAYDHVHAVPWGRHAVLRNRELAALALGYTAVDTPDYGILAPPFPPPAPEDDSPPDPDRPWLAPAERHAWLPPEPFAVLLHASSAESKAWPAYQWKKLMGHLASRGIACVLPWGSAAERARGEALAAGLTQARVPPRLGLRTMAGLLGRAALVVGVDTGLTHLSAALGRPTVGVYVSTDPRATGVLAGPWACNVGNGRGAPSLAAVIAAVQRIGVEV
jgi:heptosyltransferase-1